MKKAAVLPENYKDAKEENYGNNNARIFPVLKQTKNKEIKTLSRKEERKLMAMIKNAKNKLDAFKKTGVADKFISQAENEYIKLRNEFMTHNLRLVAKIAITATKKYGLYGLTDDMFSCGCEGLARAIEKFDLSYKVKFSTYATEWIAVAMQRQFQNEARVIRTPVHVQEMFYKLEKTTEELLRLNKREPDEEEISQKLKITRKSLKELKEKSITIISMDNQIARDDSSEIGLISSNGFSPENVAEIADSAKNTIKNLEKIFEKINPREASVVKKRIGFNEDGEGKKLEEVGNELKVSRERIRQIQMNALEKFQLTARKLVESGEIKDDPVMEKIAETDNSGFKIPLIKILDILKMTCRLMHWQIETYNAVI
ncbi:MAG: sigma-70 family RNA polymerase sigma factor [Candidatus Brennerbacteria bacterium]|nr:sigma-70 family RNA polymerase sigma factor [Candidatus Brennerbacteria bacterium]